VIIECTNCHARYQYDEDRFERKPSKKIKCAKCTTIFDIHNPAFAEKAVEPGTSSDSTLMRRDVAKKVPHDTTEQSPIPRHEESRITGPTPAQPQLPEGKRLSLAIINGTDVGNVYRIEKPRITIGRSGADLTINDTEASRLHAVVEVRESVIRLEDLKSTNGTLVDGEKIDAPVDLNNHSEFQIGGTTIMLIVTDES
jgi:pSer/pThr/pTyr-binding forkhead associated (FHA) protein